MSEDSSGGGAGREAALHKLFGRMPAELQAAHDASRQINESKFRNLAEGADEGVLCSSTEGVVTFANEAAAQILGWESSERMIGRPSVELYHATEDREKLLSLLMQHGRLDPVDLVMRSEDGRPVKVRGKVMLIDDPTGRPTEFLGVITSTRELLAEREKLDETRYRLQGAARDLEESHRELDEFAHVVSHDLREPVRMVGSFLELLQKRSGDTLDDRAGEYLGFAVEGAQRLDSQIADLLAYARVRTRGAEFERCDAEEILGLARDRLGSVIERSSAEITHDPLPAVQGDRAQLVVLLGHLLANAMKFCGEAAPRIHVKAEAAGDRHLLEVSDNGLGIAAEFKDQVFEMFTRLNTREEYPGNGAGLAVCRRIVNRHGGEIWLRSQPGEGTRVFFTLPAAVDG